MLNPWRLQLLVDLQAYGTVREVAARASLSPSAVSQQLAVLERETGTGLIERTGRRVRLTVAGVVLAGRGRELLARMAAVEAELRGLGEQPVGRVTLAVFQSAVHPLAVPAAAQVTARHPDVEVVVLEQEPHESMPALRRGAVDVIVTTTDLAATEVDPAVDLVPLGTDEIVVVLPPGHPGAAHDRIDLAACADERWTFDRTGSYMSDLATRRCREAGFEPRVVARFNNYLLALEHVATGGSISLLPLLAVDPRYAVLSRPLRPPAVRHIVAATRRTTTGQPAVRAVLDELRRRTFPSPR